MSSHSAILRTATGYSLIELLVAVSLSAIVMGMAVPRLPRLYGQYELSNAAHQIAADLVRVRTKAIGQSSRYRIVFNSAGYQILVDDGTSFVDDGSVVPLPAGTVIPSLPEPLTFSAIGLLTSAATITVSAASASKQVSINELGRVTVQ